MPYADVVVVVLTCVTVVITCAALVIGMLGVFGFKMIKDEALRNSVNKSVEKSVAASLKSLEKEMNEGGLIKKILEERAAVIIAEYNLKSISVKDWGDENKEDGE